MKIGTRYEKRTHTDFVLDQNDIERAILEHLKAKSQFWGPIPTGAAAEKVTVEFDSEDETGRITAKVTRQFIYDVPEIT